MKDWEPYEPKTVYLTIPLEKFSIKISMAEMYALLNESERTRAIWQLGRDRLLNPKAKISIYELKPIRLKNEMIQEQNHKRKKRHVAPWSIEEVEFLKIHAEELTYKEIATALGRTIESVKTRIRRLKGKK